MRLYNIASQHIVSIRARLGIWLPICSERKRHLRYQSNTAFCGLLSLVLVAQEYEKLQQGPTRYVSSPAAVNIFKCVLLDRKLKSDTTDAEHLFPTNSDGSSHHYFCDYLSIFSGGKKNQT